MPQPTFKSFESSTIDMLRWYFYRTGTPPDSIEGSVLRTIFEAVGLQNEQLSYAFDEALLAAIPESTFAAFGYAKQKSERAKVTLRLERAAPVADSFRVPKGTQARTVSGIHVETVEDTVMPPGGVQLFVRAQAIVPGSAGNVPAGTVTQLVNRVPGIETVFNEQPGFGGSDEESLTDQALRFADYLVTLAKGTLRALEVVALKTRTDTDERATQVKVVDTYLDERVPVGVARVYLYRPGGVSDDLLVGVQRALERDQRPVGVSLTVLRINPVPVHVAVTVHAPSLLVLPSVEAACYRFFAGLALGEDVDYDRLSGELYKADPSIYKVHLSVPAESAQVGNYERAELASFTPTFSAVLAQ